MYNLIRNPKERISCYIDRIIFLSVTSETEEYREWVHHEVFAECRRHEFVSYPELRALEEELSEFCSTVLDEPFLEPEEPLHKYRTYHVTNVLQKQ